MKMYRLLFLFAISLLLGSCATSKWKEFLVSSGDINNIINNTIIDFINTSKLVKKDSIFDLLITDSNDGLLIIGIAKPSDIVRPSYKNKIGTYDNVFPTRYLIKEGKLFYWNDSTQVITQEILDVLKWYDHIDFSWTELDYEMIYGVHDDGVEGVVYYVCKNDYRNYKKTGASTIKKHYKTPKLHCK